MIETISIIIPAMHEAERIGPLIEHLRRLRTTASLEIIVVDGADERDTLMAIGDGGVTKIALPINATLPGKPLGIGLWVRGDGKQQ